MPWTLYFPFATVDDRVAARENISLLRRDPYVAHIRPTYVRGQPFVVVVDFVDEQEGPLETALADRIRPFQTPLPPRDEVRSAPPERNQSMVQGFGWNYGSFPEPLSQQPIVTPPQVRDQIIQQYLESDQGRRLLAASMANPLSARRDYTGIARRAIVLDPFPQGALPIYDRDPDVASMVTPKDPDPLPDWVQEGAWVRLRLPEVMGDESTRRIAQITKIQKSERGTLYVQVQKWRTTTQEGIQAIFFVEFWEPCDKPKDPRSAWERLLDDDDDL